MFQKFKDILKRDIFPKASQVEKPPVETSKISIPRKFGILVVIVLLGFGFWAGSYYGLEVGSKIKGEALNTYNQVVRGLPWLNLKSIENNKIQKLIDESQLRLPTGLYQPITTQEEAVMNVVKTASPSVVSVVITKDVAVNGGLQIIPFGENGFPLDFNLPAPKSGTTQKQKVGGGTGFIVSIDGLFITNRHVVDDAKAFYSLITNEGKEYNFKVLDKDPLQDLAICQITKKNPQEKFPILKLGDSDTVQIGQTVVAIGNALGQFSNSVSVGIVSGLGRTITAGDGAGMSENLEDILQTDAAINRGNSGGPLLNLKGEVIGINSAVASDAQGIGFAILVNKAKRDIQSLEKYQKIVYPFLGVRYILINADLKQQEKLSVDEGAYIAKGKQAGEVAVVPGSAADKAGLKARDIVVMADGQKITQQNSLAKIIQVKNPGDKVIFKILRGKNEITVEVTLGEKTSD
ncbi:MAG: trypsin-like peptidase domain-containing protein [Candidatus Gribaldobacteria bacterium]|nr:trypsin-like peptidase domain-containing protein [Candidatus Gribaldobacteria bacterium]